MKERHNVAQLVRLEIMGARPSVELLHPEEHRVRPVCHRRPQAIPIARRREQLYIFSVQFTHRVNQNPFASLLLLIPLV